MADPRDRLRMIHAFERWLAHHEQDPRDPLSVPMRLVYDIVVTATSLKALVLRTCSIVLMTTIIAVPVVHWLTARDEAVTLAQVDPSDRADLQRWVSSGEAVRLMRCNSWGLRFSEGRCRTDSAGSWIRIEPTADASTK